MRMKVDEITNAALALPSEARAQLADRLVESLDPAEDGEMHRFWVTESQKRLHELRSGTVKSVPGDQAVAKLRRKYRR